MLSQTLPTVYSPTPSLPTITSPQSANTLQPDYFEVYRVCPIRLIDASISSTTLPTFSFSSPTPPVKSRTAVQSNKTAHAELHSRLKQDQSDSSTIFASSIRTQVSVKHIDDGTALPRRLSLMSHASSNSSTSRSSHLNIVSKISFLVLVFTLVLLGFHLVFTLYFNSKYVHLQLIVFYFFSCQIRWILHVRRR